MPGRSEWRAEAGQSDPNEKAPRPAGGIRGGATAQYSAERNQRAGSDERDIALRLAQSTNMGKFEAGRARAAELMLGRRVEAESGRGEGPQVRAFMLDAQAERIDVRIAERPCPSVEWTFAGVSARRLIAYASRRTERSSPGLPTIWNPSGSPRLSRPQGTLIAGKP